MESKVAISDKKFSPTSNILLFKLRKTKVLIFFTEILLRKCSSGHLEGIFDQPL